MPRDRSSRAPRRWPLVFLAATLVPVLALGWLTLQLVDRDRRLEGQQAQERVEHAADRIVAASHQRLSELEGELPRLASSPSDPPPAHSVLAVVTGERVTVVPAGGLVYYPTLPESVRPPRAVFAEGERFEFQHGDPGKAIDVFMGLAQSADPAIRAGALLRLGRNQMEAGRIDAALATLAELGTLGTTDVEGYPAAVLALEARCGILAAAGRQAELAADARALRSGLADGAWPLTRDVYDFYMKEARRWTGVIEETPEERDARAMAAAFQSVHDQWRRTGSAPQRQWLIAEGRPILLTSAVAEGRLLVLVAGADYLKGAWKDVTGAEVLLADSAGRSMLGASPDALLPQAVRTSDASQLPWTVRVTSTGLDADRSAAAARRRLLLAGLGTVLLLLGGSTYFTLRGMSRELAATRLQSDFVSAVSHEFRTPLASVRHLSDMLAQGRVADQQQRQQCYDFLSRESERLERLVEQLLDFGRIEGGAYRYRFERVDAPDFLRALVNEFQEKVAPKGYRIDLSVGVDRAPVLADREALSRAIWNLLDNAVKYSPDSHTVWVGLTLEDGSALIKVRDCGVGIPPSEQQEIFGKFVRGSNARAQQVKGTGIGLAMVRHIVEAHHGDVRVESQPDQGSTFSLRLPFERAA